MEVCLKNKNGEQEFITYCCTIFPAVEMNRFLTFLMRNALECHVLAELLDGCQLLVGMKPSEVFWRDSLVLLSQ